MQYIYIYALMIFHNIPNKVGEILSTKVNSICSKSLEFNMRTMARKKNHCSVAGGMSALARSPH